MHHAVTTAISRQRSALVHRRVLWAASIFAPLTLGGCKDGILSPIGPIGEAERVILFDSLAIMLAIVVPTVIATLVFAWWFRASNPRATYLPNWSYSGRLELLVWSVPALVVLFLGGIAWIGSHDLDPARPLSSTTKPLDVNIVALDWKWLFVYPQQGVASINELVVPAGTPLRFRITSASVFNVFFVPGLGSQIYAMNGMVTTLNLQADKPGTYPGLSAHFSGDGFSNMAFNLQAVSQDQFEGWVAATRQTGPRLDEAAYRTLLRQSLDARPTTYREVQPGLFDAITMQKLPPGDGPITGRPDRTVAPSGDK
jgi:cytochrome o ubiquinol oxidase subunit 2